MAGNYRDYAGELEHQYYVWCPELMTMAEFADFRRQLDRVDSA
jgi:hypothetical protein